MRWVLTFACIGLIGTSAPAAPRPSVMPQTLHGVPGEPLRVELAVESDDAAPVQLKVPTVSNLVLRAVEKIPIQRTKTGTYIQKRVIIWQGVEAGSDSITNLSVQIGAATQLLPNIEITVEPVEPSTPPEPESEAAK